jgi:hypothetical protein
MKKRSLNRLGDTSTKVQLKTVFPMVSAACFGPMEMFLKVFTIKVVETASASELTPTAANITESTKMINRTATESFHTETESSSMESGEMDACTGRARRH